MEGKTRRELREEARKEKQKKIKKIVFIILLFCVFMFGGVMLGVNWGRWFGDTPGGAQQTSGSGLQVDPGAGEYVPPESIPTDASTGIVIPGWDSITIPANTTEVAVAFPNPEQNAGKYYLTFELRLKDTGEVLYSSQLVPPGQCIQKIELLRALEEGTYAAVIHVQPYKMDAAQTATNNADMETTLVVS